VLPEIEEEFYELRHKGVLLWSGILEEELINSVFR
jgi:hypothetical protein